MRLKNYNKEYQKKNRGWFLSYFRDYNNRRKATMLRATPAWADTEKIKLVYEEAVQLGETFHVDHIVPLQSKRVCGLHVEENLRVILGRDNTAKGNRNWPDMP